MERKEKALEWLRVNFGEHTAETLVEYDEELCIFFARKKINGFLGEEKAKEFDAFVK